MLRAQGLNQHQQTDFVLGALDGDAKRELQLINQRDTGTGQKILYVLEKLYATRTTKAHVGKRGMRRELKN